MNRIISLSVSDFRITFRDVMLKSLLFFPLASFAFVRWVLPAIEVRYPEIRQYKELILMWACLQPAIMFGFIYGFIFLEEKEESIWKVIRILPVAGLKIVFSRLLIGMTVSIVAIFCILHFGLITYLPLIKEMIISVHFSLAVPLIAVSLGAFAKNRIEGLAQMKIINLLLIAPGLIYILPSDLAHISGLIPTYWTFRSLEKAGNNPEFIILTLAGFIIYISAIYLLNRKFSRTVKE